MPSQTHTTLDSGHSTPPSDDEVLVRVEGVSKKFCRSLKKSLWYGVCDIASEINPFGRTAAFANSNQSLTTDGSDGHGYGTAGGNQRADSAEFLEGHSQAGLQMDSEKPASIRSANDRRDSMDQTGSDSESVKFDSLDPSRLTLRADLRSLHLAPAPALDCDIRGKKSYSGLVTPEASLRNGEFFAVKDVSFELRQGECLGLIGHNGAGKTTLLKMLNGLIKPDAGSITMRGRVGALIALGAGFNPILTVREPEGWEARRTSNRRLAQRVQRRREGANQNIFLNGAILGMRKAEPEFLAARRTAAAGRTVGLRRLGNREPNRRQDRRDHRLF